MLCIRWLPVCALLLSACVPVRPATPLTDFVVVDSPQGLVGFDFATRRPSFSSTPAVATADWSTLFTADSSTLSRLDARTGSVLDTRPVPAGLQPVAVSTDGTKVALAAPEEASTWPPVGRTSSRIAVADTSSQTPPRIFDLKGNYEPDAFSTDDQTLFVLEYQPPSKPDRYYVRRLDLRTGAVSGVGSRSKVAVPEENMRGTRRQHVLSPDHKTLYTLYTNQPDHLHSRDLAAGLTQSTGDVYAFVHVLSLSDGWAFCVDLPQPLGMGPAEAHAMALSPDGRWLFVVDRSSGAIVVVDAEQLDVRSTAKIGADPLADRAAAVVGRDDTLFIGLANEIVGLNPRSLAVQQHIPSPATPNALGMSPDGQRLFVATADTLYALEATTGAELGSLPAIGVQAIAYVSP
jgi:DNA-binding beta-propeller fold protein YncE